MLALLAPIAGLLGVEVEGLKERMKTLVTAYAAIAVFAAIGIGFLIGAGYIALSDWIGPLYATLSLAGAFLLLALIIFLVVSSGEARRQRKRVEKKRASETSAYLTTAALTALPLLARSPMLLRLGLPAVALAALAILRDKDRDD
jgi:uncharacterized membrane protein